MANNDFTTKVCTKCGQELPATTEYFTRNNKQKNGLSPRCKTCTRADAESRRRKKGIPPRAVSRSICDNGMRRCTKCLKEYPPTVEYFGNHKSHPDGLNLWCKECSRASALKWAQEHPEENRAKSAQWFIDNPERAKSSRKDYHTRNRERDNKRNNDNYHAQKHDPDFIKRSRESSKKSRLKHADKVRERRRIYKRENHEKVNANTRNRRAKLRNAEGVHTAEDIALQYKSQKGLCWWCGKLVGDDYHVDHRIAIERGGSNWPNNICISCPTCNMSKQDKLPHEWNGRLL